MLGRLNRLNPPNAPPLLFFFLNVAMLYILTDVRYLQLSALAFFSNILRLVTLEYMCKTREQGCCMTAPDKHLEP